MQQRLSNQATAQRPPPQPSGDARAVRRRARSRARLTRFGCADALAAAPRASPFDPAPPHVARPRSPRSLPIASPLAFPRAAWGARSLDAEPRTRRGRAGRHRHTSQLSPRVGPTALVKRPTRKLRLHSQQRLQALACNSPRPSAARGQARHRPLSLLRPKPGPARPRRARVRSTSAQCSGGSTLHLAEAARASVTRDAFASSSEQPSCRVRPSSPRLLFSRRAPDSPR